MEIFDEDLPPKILHRTDGPGFSSRLLRTSSYPFDQLYNRQPYNKGTRTMSQASIPGGRTRIRIIFLTTSTGLIVVKRE